MKMIGDPFWICKFFADSGMTPQQAREKMQYFLTPEHGRIFYDLRHYVETGEFKTHDECSVLGYTASMLTSPVYGFTSLAAFDALAKLIDEGEEGELHKYLKVTEMLHKDGGVKR